MLDQRGFAVTILAISLVFPIVGRRMLFVSDPGRIGTLLLLFVVVVSLLFPLHVIAMLELVGIVVSPSLAHVLVCSVALVAGSLWLARKLLRSPLKGDTDDSHPAKEFGIQATFGGAVLVVSATWLLFVVNRFSAYPSGGDGLRYHLPLVVDWLQTGSFLLPTNPTWERSLPANAELPMFLFLAAGLERFANTGNLLAAGVLVSAVYSIGRRFTANRSAAVLPCILVASMPIVQHQAASCYVDLFGSAFLFAGLAFFLARFDASLRLDSCAWYRVALVFAGCAWGIALGTKQTMYPYVFVLVAATFVVVARESPSWRHRLGSWAFLSVGSLLHSSLWFIRGWVQTRNPIFPIAVSVFGKEIFPGYAAADITRTDYYLNFVGSRIGWLVYPWVEYYAPTNDYGTGQGLGALWVTIVPVGVAWGVFRLRHLPCNASVYRAMLGAWAALIPIWFVWLRMMPRFGLPLMIGAALLCVPLADSLLKREPLRFRRLVLLGTICASISAFDPLHALLGRFRSMAWSRAEIYEYPPIVDRFPGGTVVWNPQGGPQNYILAGESLSNKVIAAEWERAASALTLVRDRRVDYVAYRPLEGLDLTTTLMEIGGRRVYARKAGPTHLWEVWRVSSPEANPTTGDKKHE